MSAPRAGAAAHEQRSAGAPLSWVCCYRVSRRSVRADCAALATVWCRSPGRRPQWDQATSPVQPPAPPPSRVQSLWTHSVLMDQDAADILAIKHVLIPLVDVLEPVRAGDQLVELEPASTVQVEQARDLVERIAATKQRAFDPLLEQR